MKVRIAIPNTVAVFRHWYDLARELGYCSRQEIRERE